MLVSYIPRFRLAHLRTEPVTGCKMGEYTTNTNAVTRSYKLVPWLLVSPVAME